MVYCSECGSGNKSHQPWCRIALYEHDSFEETPHASYDLDSLEREFKKRLYAKPEPHAVPGDNPSGIHRTPRTLLKDAIQRSLGWASETELRDIVFRYTGVRMELGECNRFSQEIAEIVIKAMTQ